MTHQTSLFRLTIDILKYKAFGIVFRWFNAYSNINCDSFHYNKAFALYFGSLMKSPYFLAQRIVESWGPTISVQVNYKGKE